MTSSGVRLWLANPIRVYPPDSYLVSCAFWSATISMCTFVTVPVEPPHQLATGAKSIDCFGVRAVILNWPVPIAVEGSLAQVESVALPAASTTFLSTTHAVHSAVSVYQ